jgi:hypothetical protein
MSLPKRYLEGLCYPATRLEALKHALARGADDRTVGALRRLPNRYYRNFQDLAAELERAAKVRRAA